MQFQILMLMSIAIVTALPFTLPPPEDVTVDMINNLPPGTLTPELVSQLPPGYVEKLSPEVMAVIPDDLKQNAMVAIDTPSTPSVPVQEIPIIGTSKNGGYYTNLKDASVLLPPNLSSQNSPPKVQKNKIDTKIETPEYSGANSLEITFTLSFLISIFYFI